jgi:hypothetical protein
MRLCDELEEGTVHRLGAEIGELMHSQERSVRR